MTTNNVNEPNYIPGWDIDSEDTYTKQRTQLRHKLILGWFITTCALTLSICLLISSYEPVLVTDNLIFIN